MRGPLLHHISGSVLKEKWTKTPVLSSLVGACSGQSFMRGCAVAILLLLVVVHASLYRVLIESMCRSLTATVKA